ncbi:hypothetical protein COCC4DRAFT_68786 [Bipolaris maydis ATCC 48331]|uniref:DUF1993 domain-containing protein n=2 Tax=Cochliobolus heterostrophus TaxID=5016 RepID=M2SYT4_COCH5|nr:uncharacterized protein COCC4DRAFT_68786 [Bipolaris maydis ATCC 48331]EMD90545.1 hypothetical protein COCHEDRAFT_1179472 [Bipolaris maydis C5]KAJ5023637.1 hypothetical protein J3E73DRAFT_332552 [Bipolaris maydis]ENI09243.1 hypothetical protein COCC4DRAFT_68786 [Bipolaris maydis ATCC 48331]KAJ5058419.1 hypothetical protein J3E74DRAFT_360236 [Bipolaris maydis]KAJ6195661.1 hypothetical protein J3E72DRAFT_339082 [Bipolaris maydis]
MASLSFYTMAIAPTITAMKNTLAFIKKGHEHALSNKIDPETFLTASLHPDMKDFRFQIYRMTDAVKFMPPRINPALETISLPDDEKTFEELEARIEKTLKYLESFKPADFEGKEANEVLMKFPNGMQIRLPAVDYVYKFAHPNMWFHITTAYGILRMKGVDVGKFDFLNGAKEIVIEQVEEQK